MKRFLFLLPVLCLLACSKNSDPEPKLTKYSYELYHGDKVPIEGENIQNAIWESDYKFVATAANGYIEARYIGEALVTSPENRFSFKVTVNPQYQLFEWEYYNKCIDVEWGMSEDVFRVQYPLNYWNNEYLGIKTDESMVPVILYHFTNEKLDYFALGVNIKYGEKLVDYLAERYEPLTQVSTYDFTFVHRNKQDKPDLLVYVSIDTSLITVMYMPSSTKTKSAEPNMDEVTKLLYQMN